MTRIDTKAAPINDNDYKCHITAIELVQSYGVHIMPHHVTSDYSLRDRHIHTLTDVCTESILRNQARRRAPGSITSNRDLGKGRIWNNGITE